MIGSMNLYFDFNTPNMVIDTYQIYIYNNTLFRQVAILKIVQFSLCEGVFPDSFRQAIAMPLLKKPTLDKYTFKNYRPVSNLNFLSKVTSVGIQGLPFHKKTLFSLSTATFLSLWKKKIVQLLRSLT